MSTQSLDRLVKSHTIASLVVVGIYLLLNVYIPMLLEPITDMDPTLMRMALNIVSYMILIWYLKRMDAKYINSYNRSLEQKALLLGDDFKNMNITSEESYKIMKQLVEKYESDHHGA